MNKGTKLILIGIMFFVLGFVPPIKVLVSAFFQKGNDVIIVAPGTVELSVDKPGHYYLWNNVAILHEGQFYSFGDTLPSDISFAIREKLTGANMPLVSDMNFSYKDGNRKKLIVGHFELDQPGKYVVSISGNKEKRIFSLSDKNPFDQFASFFKAAGLSLLAGVISVLFVIWGVVCLVRDSKSTQNQPPTNYPPGQQPRVWG